MNILKTKAVNFIKRLVSLKEQETNKLYEQKEQLEPIREELAKILHYKNKKGEFDTKQVKENLVKDAILILNGEKENKLKQQYNELMDFIQTIKDNEDLFEMAKSVVKTEEIINIVKEDYKFVKKELDFTEDEHKELDKKEKDDKQFIKESESVSSVKTKQYKQQKEYEYKVARGLNPKEPNTDIENTLKNNTIFDIYELYQQV